MEFTFAVFSRRWGHNDTYRLTKTATGWDIQHMAHSGPCDQEGSPHLIGNFNQDYIRYPIGVGGFLSFVWRQLEARDIDDAKAQEMIQEIADWVSACETSQPRWAGWNT